jgi:hypothetical protein
MDQECRPPAAGPTVGDGTPTPRNVTLDVCALSGADAERVRVFLPYCNGRTRLAWQLAADGEAGLVRFVAADGPATGAAALHEPGTVVQVCRRDALRLPAGHGLLLFSPLQLEEFIQVLAAIEGCLAPPAAAAPPATPRPQDAPPAPLAMDAAYHLRRWPPAGLLNSHRYSVRMASFLSARYLTPERLGLLSNVDLAHCVDFLSRLHALGLLEHEVEHPAAGGRALHAAPPADPLPGHTPAAQPPPPQAGGLLDRIRRRLGFD